MTTHEIAIVRFIARSPDGVPRCWGEGQTLEIAEARCITELHRYVRGRPEWPLSAFTIERE